MDASRPLRRALYPLRLAAARVASRGERVALVGLGIAAGAAMLAAVLGGTAVAQDRSLARATAGLAQADRTVRATWEGIPGQNREGYASLDRLAGREVGAFGSPVRVELVRETEVGGKLVDVGAVDGLARFVRLRSGRLPRRCTPARCEVVQLGGHGPIPSVAGLRLVRVGRAALASQVPLGNLITPETNKTILGQALLYHTPATPPFLLADGVRGLASAPALADTYRSYSWVALLRAGTVHPWSVESFAAAVTRARTTLEQRSGLFDLTAPTDQLAQARDEASAAGRRLLLLGGEAAALLLAFTVLAAATLRRDAHAARRRLRWFGARRWQLALFAAFEALAIAAVAAVAGWAIGAGIAAVIAGRAGSPAGAVLAHSVVSPGGIAVAAGLATAAAVVLLAVLVEHRRRGPVGLLDVAALGALAAIVLALVRGGADAQALASDHGTGVLLLLLPGLVAFVAAVVLARVLGPALRALERAGRRGPIPLRLAALSLARHPGRAEVGVGFLVVSVGFALFAATYRSTLERAQTDAARYAVPADYVLSEDLSKLVPVVDVGAPASARATPVLRLSGDVSRLNGSGFTLLGVPARTLPEVGGWRSDFSALSLHELATRLAPAEPARLRAARLPAAARMIDAPFRVAGDPVRLSAAVETPRGTFVNVDLGTRGRGAIPLEARGGRLVALVLGLTATGLHGAPNGGTGLQPIARGTLTLGPVRAGGRSLVDARDWLGVGGVRVAGGGDGRVVLRYFLTPDVDSRVRMRQPLEGAPLPVAASPAVARAAGAAGALPLEIEGRRVPARVVAVLDRFPSVSGNVVLADLDAVSTKLNSIAPGAAVPSELWLHGPPSLEQTLAQPPYTALAVASRSALESQLRADPLARGILLALAAAAAAALLLALAGLELGLVADLKDESGELFDLEAQGADPAALRRHLRLRAWSVAGVGLVGGLVLGAILAGLVVAFVTLTANTGTTDPPLRLALDWPLLGLAVLAYVALAAALVGATTAGAFRSRAPQRSAEAAA